MTTRILGLVVMGDSYWDKIEMGVFLANQCYVGTRRGSLYKFTRFFVSRIHTRERMNYCRGRRGGGEGAWVEAIKRKRMR